MSQKDILSGLAVDKILDDVKHLQGEKGSRLWSLSEVDALLSDEEKPAAKNGGEASPRPVLSDMPQDPAAGAKPEAQPEKPIEAPAAVPEPAARKETVSPQLEKREPPKKGVSLKEAARRAARMESADELSPEVPPQASDGEIEPLFTGAPPQAEAPNQEEAKPLPEDLPGQISIEKTRVFNEVESHAVHRSGIEHQIGNRVLRTTTGEFDAVVPKRRVMETDEKRDRFLNRPQQKLEKTQEHKRLLEQMPPKTIEKPGVIVRKAEEAAQGDLQAIPTLVTPEDVLKDQKAHPEQQAGNFSAFAAEDKEAPLENQMMLDGYDTHEEPVEQIDEEVAEASLRRRRRERAKDFRLFPGLSAAENAENAAQNGELAEAPSDEAEARTRAVPELPETQAGADTDEPFEEEEEAPRRRRRRAPKPERAPIRVLREFYGPKDAQAVFDIFVSEKRGFTVRMWLSLIFLLAAAASALLVRFTGGFSLLGGDPAVYSALHLVLLVCGFLVSLPQMKIAFSGIVHRRTTAETGLLVALLFALVQAAVSLAYPERLTEIPLYSAPAFLLLTLYYAGRRRGLKEDIQDFMLVAERSSRFSSVARIESPETAFEIGRGLLLGDPDVRYSKKIAFPTDFVRVSKTNDRDFDVYTNALPAVLIAAFLIGAVTSFIRNDVFAGISAIAATVLVGLPVAAVPGSAAALGGVNRRLRAQNSLLSSYDAAFDAVTANAVVLDAAELFDGCRCRLCGMKTYHKMRVDEALLYTAAMTIRSGGTLSDVFDAVILKKREILPPVESLAYEERLGCSGWIYNQRVLVGSRDLLLKHNVDAPSREEEQRFKKDGCEVLYLAVEGKTAALFVVEYASDKQISVYLQRLEKYGVTILLRTSDPNITEALVEQYFDLPHNLVKIINPVAGDMFRELCEEPPRPEPCAILHSGSTAAALRAFLAAFVLEEKYRLSQVLLYIGVGLSVLLMAVLSFFSSLGQAGIAEILIFELFWAAVVLLIPKFKKV